MKNFLYLLGPCMMLAVSCAQPNETSRANSIQVRPMALLKTATDVFCSLTGGQTFTQAEQQGASTLVSELWNLPGILKSSTTVINNTSINIASGYMLRETSKASYNFVNSPTGVQLIARWSARLPKPIVEKVVQNAIISKTVEDIVIKQMRWRLPPTIGQALKEGAIAYVEGRVACDALRSAVAAGDFLSQSYANNQAEKADAKWTQETCKRLIAREQSGELKGKLPDFCSE